MNILFGRLFIATTSSISSTTASSVWRNLNGTRRNFVKEKERSLCQGRKGPRHVERRKSGSSVSHISQECLLHSGTCFPLLALTRRFPKSVKKSVESSSQGVLVSGTRAPGSPTIPSSCEAVHSNRACARASASGGNRFT